MQIVSFDNLQQMSRHFSKKNMFVLKKIINLSSPDFAHRIVMFLDHIYIQYVKKMPPEMRNSMPRFCMWFDTLLYLIFLSNYFNIRSYTTKLWARYPWSTMCSWPSRQGPVLHACFTRRILICQMISKSLHHASERYMLDMDYCHWSIQAITIIISKNVAFGSKEHTKERKQEIRFC